MLNRRANKWTVPVLIVASLAVASPAFALQPLSAFLEGARRASVDNREAALRAIEQQEEALVSLGRSLPSVSARGTYTRNQYESAVTVSPMPGAPLEKIVIVPQDQWDAFLQVDVPVVDLAAWARARAARASARAARHDSRATLLDVEKQVARSYYQLIGAEALRASAQRTLGASQANHDLTRDRKRAGVATELDVQRAAAEVERARQSIADAELSARLAARALTTLTGVVAAEDIAPTVDDLHEEAALEQWQQTSTEQIPALRAAAEQRRSADLGAQAAKLALLPTLSATGVERFTNATGFSGRDSFFTFLLTLNWRFDLSTLGTLRAQAAAADGAGVREERVRLQVADQIHEAWQRVRAGIAIGRAARAQAQAALLAEGHARQRYASGVGTQLEVIEAQRDAFAAEVARIQADADLSYARALLRLSVGQPLDPEHEQ